MAQTIDDKMAARKRWRKILYEDQGVPDNYVDSTFLEELKKNRVYIPFLIQFSYMFLSLLFV